MLGYADGELEGMLHWTVYHKDYQELTRRRAIAGMQGEKLASQYEVKLQKLGRITEVNWLKDTLKKISDDKNINYLHQIGKLPPQMLIKSSIASEMVPKNWTET